MLLILVELVTHQHLIMHFGELFVACIDILKLTSGRRTWRSLTSDVLTTVNIIVRLLLLLLLSWPILMSSPARIERRLRAGSRMAVWAPSIVCVIGTI